MFLSFIHLSLLLLPPPPLLLPFPRANYFALLLHLHLLPLLLLLRMEFIGNNHGGRGGSIGASFYLGAHRQEEEEVVVDLQQFDAICKRRPPFTATSPSASPSSSVFSWREGVPVVPSGGDAMMPEKEPMFDKVVTPSDVGKLNRLVIPKQHAEKHFPLDTASAAEKKGLLLCFEDRVTGKHWRFRYSYWHSSQSYVMTKGWSRFVKEKGLHAGDTVSFARGVGDAARHRFFIDCRRQPEKRFPSAAAAAARIPLAGFSSFVPPWVGGRAFFPSAVGPRLLYFKMPATRPPPPPPPPPQAPQLQQVGVGNRCTIANEEAAATGVKRLRLFGVNFDFPGSGAAAHYSQLLQPPQMTSQTLPPPPPPPPPGFNEQRSAMDLY